MEIYRPFKSVPELKSEEYNNTYLPYVFLNSPFTKEELDKINDLWDEQQAREGTLSGSDNVNYDKRKAREQFIQQDGNEWIYDKIGLTCIMVNTTRFKLEITGFRGPLRLLQYKEGDFFDWHMDLAPGSHSTRKVVACIQLSDEEEYSGGDLQLVTENTSVPKSKGSIAVFPSYLLHRVTPVLSGCRKSLVALIAGPPYR